MFHPEMAEQEDCFCSVWPMVQMTVEFDRAKSKSQAVKTDTVLYTVKKA